jgi:hypothetical protein
MYELLVSPLGLSRGLLYSALRLVPADRCLVIGSQRSLAALDEIRDRAEYPGEIITYTMRDPFTGFTEIPEMLDRVMPTVTAAAQVVVNVTGGTTAQQCAVQAIAKKAKKNRPLRQIALVDRRDPQEQRNEPYVVGESIALDDYL